MTKKIQKRHVLSVHVENESGVLNRVASLFRRRRFNIESLSVGPTEQPKISRMTIVLDAEKTNVEQAIKQMYKIVNVLKITELSEEDSVARELALIKVNATKANRSEIIQIVDIYRAKIVDASLNALTIQLVAKASSVDAFIVLMNNFGIKELVRTGLSAIQRS